MPELLQRPCPLHLTSRPQTSRRGHRRHSGAHLCRAAASGAASFPSQPSEDPYQVGAIFCKLSARCCLTANCRLLPQQPLALHSSKATDAQPLQVLGLPRNADSESIQRVYNKKKRENRDNQEVLDRIEKAHSTLMMRQFTMRVQARAASLSSSCRFKCCLQRCEHGLCAVFGLDWAPSFCCGMYLSTLKLAWLAACWQRRCGVPSPCRLSTVLHRKGTPLCRQCWVSGMQGGGKDVAKEIRFADKPQYLPWRPR